jgi:hypothetical protein
LDDLKDFCCAGCRRFESRCLKILRSRSERKFWRENAADYKKTTACPGAAVNYQGDSLREKLSILGLLNNQKKNDGIFVKSVDSVQINIYEADLVEFSFSANI